MKTNPSTLAVLMAAAMSAVAQPVITTQPQDKLAIPGQTITLTVSASGIAPLSYQWQRDNSPLPSKTTTSLTFTSIQVVDAGNYSVVVTDSSGSTNSRVATVAVIGPVALDPKLSENIRLGNDPPALPANLRAQAEPHIARSFSDSNLLVAIFQEGRYTDGGAADCGYSVSTNGGLTWSRALIPGLTPPSGGSWYRVSDPVAAIDLQGSIYLNTLIARYSLPGDATAISKSTNWGQTFGGPQLVVAPGPETDKQWIAINTFWNSPASNRVVLIYSRLGDGKDQLHATFSDDSGSTWSSVVLAGPVRGYACQPFFLPDGTFANVYTHYLRGFNELDSDAQFEMVLSSDGGATFGSPLLITTNTRPLYHDPIARDAWDLTSACSDRQAGVIFVTYQLLFGPATNRVPSILFTKSINKGTTWSTPVVVNDTPSGKGVFNPAIAVSPDGQHVVIEFYDKRHQTTNSANNYVDLYLAESFDGGDTWQPNLRLSDVSSDLRLAPLTGDGRMLGDYQGIVPALNFGVPGVAVWIDTRNGNPDPYVVRINRTKGTTFDTWRKLRFSTNDLANLAISGENADPDCDGIPNLAEYAFGFEPTRADPGPLQIALNASAPTPTAYVSYERLAVLSDIQFCWQASANLADWTPVSPTEEQLGPGRDPSMQRVEASFTAGDQMRFFRLNLWRAPPAP